MCGKYWYLSTYDKSLYTMWFLGSPIYRIGLILSSYGSVIVLWPRLGTQISKTALLWRHNGHDCVPNHQPHHCLLNCLFGRRSKKTSKLRVTGLCVGNSPGNGEFPAQMASNAENVSIWWRRHGNKIRACISFTGGNRTKLPSSRWRRRGRSLREVFACSCIFETTDLSQIYTRQTRRHGTPCTKTTDSYLFSFVYNNPRKIRRETTVGKFVPNNGRR